MGTVFAAAAPITTSSSVSPLVTLFITIAGGVTTALILTFLIGRQQRASKKEDWEHQAEMEQLAEEREQARIKAAEKVQDQVAEAAKLALEANDRVTATAETANQKLDGIVATSAVIHTLVNSNLTTEMDEHLDALKNALTEKRKNVALKEEHDEEPTVVEAASIAALEQKISEKELALAERHSQNKVAEKQIKSGRVV